MKKNLFFAAVAIVALASCADNEYVGDNSPNQNPDANSGDAIVFSSGTSAFTRADIGGKAAADLLDNYFYVTGTKGTEAATSPTPTLVFDNYLVHYSVNTAGVTESNTANWEYVGVTPDDDHIKLSSLSTQSIKYWDYSAAQYDFLAFSTGSSKAVNSTTPSTGEIGVTASKYGANLASSATAYTFYLPDLDAIQNAYITDITEVPKSSYGKEVTLKFKNLGSKIRVALYETVPGYSVTNVIFYTVDGTSTFTDANKSGTAKLISADANGLPTNGTIKVYFPHVGDNNKDEQDYDKAAATVVSPESGATYDKYKDFGALTAQLTGKDPNGYEANDNVYIGRSLPEATFAGSSAGDFYQTVFPVSTSSPLTLRVDYTLVSTDGSGETINVYGAKAVVPATYTKWLPNYAYTYIFKISDNTNGWTTQTVTEDTPAGLFPITFDAVVAEATDATAEQTTITTVATPSITTYQQNHKYTTNEYSIATGKDIYVQVMDNKTTSATLKGDLNGTTPTDGTARSLFYKLSNASATEAMVMDALENRTTALNVDNVTGRNTLVLTKNDNIDATVQSIVNGVDDNPIGITAGQAAKIAITAEGFETGSYAYVYDYSDAAKTTTDIYQPIAVEVGTTDVEGVKFVTNLALSYWDNETGSHYTDSENAAKGFLYFSITTNGGDTKTYSFISVDDKIGQALPDGLLKLPVGQLQTGAENAKAEANTFYFNIYIRNTGKYAVKVIKVVD